MAILRLHIDAPDVAVLAIAGGDNPGIQSGEALPSGRADSDSRHFCHKGLVVQVLAGLGDELGAESRPLGLNHGVGHAQVAPQAVKVLGDDPVLLGNGGSKVR
jgi:hypothetical protein